MIALGLRRATWIGLPLLGGLAIVAPPVARIVTLAFIGTIGVAHGANDDRILARLAPRWPGGRATISVTYAALALGVFAAARRAPRNASRALSLLAWYHFGSGDVALARECEPRPRAFIDSAVRGAIPLTVDPRRPGARIAFALVLCYAAFIAARGAFADAADVAIPAITLRFAPVPLGFAGYFGLWHAPRHLALLLERDVRGGSLPTRLRRFANESSLNTVLAFVVGAVLFGALRARSEPRDVMVALVLGVTVPHQAVVWYAERVALRRP